MTDRLLELQDKMKDKLDSGRYEHTLGVMYTAGALAMRYGINLDKALIAGLLHDCAKCYSDEKKFKLCDKYGVKLSDYEKKNTALIHAKLGAAVAKHKYDIDDEEILSAIRFHTTGCPNMSTLDKIVFISDYIEPHRDKANRLDEIRSAAFDSLDKALVMILEDTLSFLTGRNKVIDETTRLTYEYYIHK